MRIGGKADRLAADQLGALGDLGHPQRGLGDLAPVVALEQLDQVGMAHHRRAHRAGHALDRHVVVRRPHAARGEDHVEAPAEGRDLLGDEVHLVGNHGDAAHVHAERAQLAAQVGGVGVLDLARQDLVADEDDPGRLRHAGGNFTLECAATHDPLHHSGAPARVGARPRRVVRLRRGHRARAGRRGPRHLRRPPRSARHAAQRRARRRRGRGARSPRALLQRERGRPRPPGRGGGGDGQDAGRARRDRAACASCCTRWPSAR